MTAGATTPGPTTPGPPGHVPSIRRRGLMLVLSSPSGAGKTSIAHGLLELEPELTLSVSVTTRPRRPGERDGVDYYFIDRGALRRDGRAKASCSSTPRSTITATARRARAVEAALSAGRDVLFDIDWQGTQQLRELARRYGHRVHPAALDRRAGAPSARPAPGHARRRFASAWPRWRPTSPTGPSTTTW